MSIDYRDSQSGSGRPVTWADMGEVARKPPICRVDNLVSIRKKLLFARANQNIRKIRTQFGAQTRCFPFVYTGRRHNGKINQGHGRPSLTPTPFSFLQRSFLAWQGDSWRRLPCSCNEGTAELCSPRAYSVRLIFQLWRSLFFSDNYAGRTVHIPRRILCILPHASVHSNLHVP